MPTYPEITLASIFSIWYWQVTHYDRGRDTKKPHTLAWRLVWGSRKDNCMKYSQEESSPQAESYFLNVCVPLMKIPLQPRARIVWDKLRKRKFPVSARKLSQLLGQLRISERTVGVALRQLLEHRLVTQSKAGWTAVPALPGIFQMDRQGHHPLYFTLTTPKENPFPDQKNAIELLSVYFCCLHLEGKTVHNTDVAERTGITRKTVGQCVKELQALQLLDDDKHALPQTWENAVHSPDDGQPTKTKKEGKREVDSDLNPISQLLGKTTNESECLRITARLRKLGVSLDSITADIKRAIQQHRANGAVGDGSALVLSWLQKRLDIAEGQKTRTNDAAAADEARRYRQLCDTMLNRVIGEDRDAARSELPDYTYSQLEAADMELEGFGRLISWAEMSKVIADPTRANALNKPPKTPPVIEEDDDTAEEIAAMFANA